MTLLGTLTFLGLAVVTVDVLGGVLATTFLARGVPPVHLLAFVGGYATVVALATVVLHPLLRVLGALLHPLLASNDALGVVELVVGLALIGVAIHQRRSALRPRVPRTARVRDRLPSLVVGGMAFALTALADPAFAIAVGLAGQERHLVLRILLLVAWNVLYQAPLLAVVTLSLVGAHERALGALGRLLGPRRRLLLSVLALVLLVGGLVVIGDGAYALLTQHQPWLRDLLGLR